jgi:hypothetical protein
MKSFIKRGEIRISPASYYKDGAALNPRTDDELNKKRSLLGERSRIITKDGKEIPIIGDIHETVSMPANYYALCMSTNFEPYIFEEFKDYDSCVIIKDSEQFMVRLEMCSKNIIPNCDFHYNPVEYFDPCEPCKDQFFNPAMCKDFRFAYQTEYRAIWYPLEDSYIKNHIVLNLGSLEDICELYIK